MKILVARSAGFCFGVKRAVDALYAVDKATVTLGPIIHNRQVVDDLADKGIRAVASIAEVPAGAQLAIRTHGVAEAVICQAEESGIPYMDLTCPFVKKIHHIVREKSGEGYTIVIVGDASHPEVQGICGWCKNSLIALDISDLHGKIEDSEKVCLVSQTTMDKQTFEKIEKFLKNRCKTVVVFDTICNATAIRQAEAKKIAAQSDCMIVIGGHHSANTAKLADICRQECGRVYTIECFEELPQNIYMPGITLGITAGASTPPWIIKEVVEKMDEMNKNGGDTFAQEFEEYEKSLVTLNTGDIVKGTVLGVTEKGVSVNLGYKSDGFIPAGEMTDDPDANIFDLVKEGDEIEAFVVRVNDVEGEVTLSKKKIDAIKSEKFLEEAAETHVVLSGKVIRAVNGGVIVSYKGSQVFVPASQASDRYLSDLSSIVGNDVEFRIIEVKKVRGRNKVVGSIKEVLKERKAVLAEEFWKNVEVGKVYTGTVKSLTNFGAFVDIGGVDGLIHISELSWSKIKHPSEVVNVGDVVEVYVLDFDKEKGKVSLGFKKAEDNPWVKAKNELSVGQVIDCKIVRIVPFGAFAEIYPGVDGLIHISQVANKRIGRVEDELMVGQHVQAKIVELDFENQKIGLSIRALLEENEQKENEEIMKEAGVMTEEEAAAAKAAELEAEIVETVEEPVVQEAAGEPAAEQPAEEQAEETESPAAEETTEE